MTYSMNKRLNERSFQSQSNDSCFGCAILCKFHIQIEKVPDIRHLLVSKVGITGLEPATSRPPDVCATNCAKSRFCDAKVYTLNEKSKLLAEIFLKKRFFNGISIA